MKVMILFLTVNALFLSCNSQEIKGKKHKGDNKPHEQITVTKRYDENGNLIELDSVYTSYYSTFKRDTFNTENIMNEFSEYFNNNMGEMFSNNFYTIDSILMPGFFHHDFFENQFLEQNKEMLKMLQQLDSIKNSYFKIQSEQYLKQE
jgi:hypothetical protein